MLVLITLSFQRFDTRDKSVTHTIWIEISYVEGFYVWLVKHFAIEWRSSVI
jgi:hypothetical protein